MKWLDLLWKPAVRAVGVQLTLAAAVVMDWLSPVRFEVGPDGRLNPRRG